MKFYYLKPYLVNDSAPQQGVRISFKTGFVYLRNLLAGAGERTIEYINVLAFVFERDRTAKPYINWGYV